MLLIPGDLWVSTHTGLQSKFQNNQGCIEKSYLGEERKREGEEEGKGRKDVLPSVFYHNGISREQ